MVADDARITVRCWHDGVAADRLLPLRQVAELITDPTVLVWVDLVRPSPGQVQQLGALLGLSPVTVEAALAESARPRLTRHATALSFTLARVRLSDARPGSDRLVISRVSGFVLPGALITVRTDTAPDLAAVEAVWADNADLLRLGADALVYGLVDVVVDEHLATIEDLDDQVDDLEDELFAEVRTSGDFVRRVYGVRKDLVRLRRVVLPMREVVNGLLRHGANAHPDPAHRELDPWLDDLYDRVIRAAELTESMRDLVATVFETNLSLQDSRLNQVMKKLAAWAAIIAVPTAITGWFGQNIPYWGYESPVGLWVSVVSIVIASGALYLAFRTRDWL